MDQVTVELAGEWIAEIKMEVGKKLEAEEAVERKVERAWDDVNEGWELPVEKVRAARAEEVAYMEGEISGLFVQ